MITSHPNLPVLYLISLIITIIITIPSSLIIISIIIISIRKILNSIGNIGHTNHLQWIRGSRVNPARKNTHPSGLPLPCVDFPAPIKAPDAESPQRNPGLTCTCQYVSVGWIWKFKVGLLPCQLVSVDIFLVIDLVLVFQVWFVCFLWCFFIWCLVWLCMITVCG